LQMRARQGHVEILIHVLKAFENLIWDVVPPDASGKPCVNWIEIFNDVYWFRDLFGCIYSTYWNLGTSIEVFIHVSCSWGSHLESYIKSHTHWKHWASNGLKFSSTSICSKNASTFTQDNLYNL
jgi:hypothetical protein